jgi:hypothetical protein
MKWYDWVAVGLWVLGVCVYARILYQDRMRTGRGTGKGSREGATRVERTVRGGCSLCHCRLSTGIIIAAVIWGIRSC